MTKSRSVKAAEIPLYLIPQAITRLIRLIGNAVYRISVVRTHWHHYRISVRKKKPEKEPLPADGAAGETEGAKKAKKRGRGCPV